MHHNDKTPIPTATPKLAESFMRAQQESGNNGESS